MKLRDVCPCRLGTFPEIIMTSGMTLVCTEGHKIVVSFNYLPRELSKDVVRKASSTEEAKEI